MEGDSLLHVVAACGDTQDYLDCAKMIVRNKEKKSGADGKRRALEARNNKGDTPLHCAAGAGNTNMIGCLIDLIPSTTDDEAAAKKAKKALVRTQNVCGETALHQAIRARNNKVACIDQLMAMDPELACIPHEDGASPLHLAISLGEIEIAERLLDDKSRGKLSYSGPDGSNVLHAAVYSGKAVCQMILDWLKKEDELEKDRRSVPLVPQLTSQRDKKHKGSTPLHLAASLDCQTAILLLRANESAAYQADDEGSYPIHVAARADSSLVVVKMLLERFTDCATLRDGKGRTFLHVATEEECPDVVRYVCGEMPQRLSSMIDLNAQDNNGDTALHGAVRDGNLAVFNYLFRNRQVRLDVPNKDGITPLDLSWTTKPKWFYYGFAPGEIVDRSLRAAEAPHSRGLPLEFFTEKQHRPKSDPDKESKKYTEATQVMSIVATLTATATFAAAFTLPGGHRADGEPALAGSYAFDAFILADTLAFICSISATGTLVYAGLPVMDSAIRLRCIKVSAFLLLTAARSLVAVFGLGLYLVAHHTASAIAACLIVLVSLLYGHMELWQIIRMANTVRARIGIRDKVVYFALWILSTVFMHFGSYVIIFSLPAYRKRVL